MSRTRPTARLVALALVGASSMAATTLATSSSAAADAPWTTTTSATAEAGVVVFGGVVDIEVDVDSPDGGAPTRGTSTLMALEAGSTDWVVVATSTSPGTDFLDVRPWMDTTYKVTYSGSADTGNGDSWASSESDPVTIGVKRRIVHPTSGFDLSGRVTPRFGRKLVMVRASRDQSQGYTRVKALRTDRRGRYSYVLPKRRGTWYWIVRVKGDSRFRGNAFAYETNVFRQSGERRLLAGRRRSGVDLGR